MKTGLAANLERKGKQMVEYVIIGKTYRHDATGKTMRVTSASRIKEIGLVQLINGCNDETGWSEMWQGNIKDFCAQWTKVKDKTGGEST
jgi:hypothetical protein